MKGYDLLEDLKILDLSRIFTGPFATQILIDLGAKVIKVEPPSGDDTRYWGPPFLDTKEKMSTYFASLNRGKESINLNLKEVNDYERLVELVRWADIIIENFKPGVTRKLKIDYQTLRKINDEIIYLSITGFGSEGPYQNHPSYDLIAQAESGIMSITGTEEGKFAKVGVPIADIAAGMYGVIGVLTALYAKTKTNSGQMVETNLFNALTSWLTYQSMNEQFGQTPKPMGTGHPNIVPYQAFLCKDNRQIVVSVGNNKIWMQFVELLKKTIGSHKTRFLDDKKFRNNNHRVENKDSLIPQLQRLFLYHDTGFWLQELVNNGVPCGKINNIQDVHSHPQVDHSNNFDRMQIGNDTVQLFKIPLKFSNAGFKDISPPPNIK